MPLQHVSSNTVFTITFTLEVVNSGIWEDHKAGFLELERSIRVIKLSYTLYPNVTLGVDVEIWPQAARVTAGDKQCWVRTWQFLERRWLSFSIRHEIFVRVREMMLCTAKVNFSTGSGGSSTPVIVFPPLPFGVRRYFGPVKENNALVDMERTVQQWIWSALEGLFPVLNEPFPVSDIRHQDKLLEIVNDRTLNPTEKVHEISTEQRSKGKLAKEKGVTVKPSPYEIYLPGDFILAGVGRVIPFEVLGDYPAEVGEMLIFLSSSNLPAPDDDPIVFVNINKLFDVPLPELRTYGITHLYTRWKLGEEVHDSVHFSIVDSKEDTEVKFNDHHTLPLEPMKVNETTCTFLDCYFPIELRGIRESQEISVEPTLFGYDKADRDYDSKTPKIPKDKLKDFVIAVTKIDARSLSKGLNAFINEEYPLYPARLSVSPLDRAKTCSNDINLIGRPLVPEVVVPASLVLSAQMTLEVSMGVVGCKPPRLTPCFSRLYCLIGDTFGAMSMLAGVRTINEELASTKPEAMLTGEFSKYISTGFAVDTGDVVVLFLEGPRDGNILKVWELSEEFHPKVKPVFNSSSRYSKRIYVEFLKELAPFIVLKMHMPLGVLLACPAVYVRPALPNPARMATLKLGRLIQAKYRAMPPPIELPSAAELRSFRLELCAPLRSFPTAVEKRFSAMPADVSIISVDKNDVADCSHPALPTRINWQSMNS